MAMALPIKPQHAIPFNLRKPLAGPLRFKAAVAAAPISEIQAVFEGNPIPVIIQTGDHDGPIAPIVAVNPAMVRPVYDKLANDRAFIVADAASHAQHTNYPLLLTPD